MKRRPSLLVGLFLCAGIGVGLTAMSPTRTQTVKWRHNYEAAVREAKEKDLPIVVDFGTSNCYWCTKLDEITFRDPAVIKLLNDRFVPIKVNAEKLPELAEALNISAYPTLVFAGPDGKILDKHVGFVKAADMNRKLKETLADVVRPDPNIRQVSTNPK